MTVTIKKEIHNKQAEYMQTEEFKDLYKERYKIEQKNNEIKNIGDMKVAIGSGQLGMIIQGQYVFLANMKRIRTLREKKSHYKLCC